MHMAKITKLMDLLMNYSTIANAFETFCGILVKDHPWLSKELMADLNAERGCLDIDPDVQKEASMMVHRYVPVCCYSRTHYMMSLIIFPLPNVSSDLAIRWQHRLL